MNGMGEEAKRYSVYVGHIPRGTSEEALRHLFSECGPIREVLMHTNQKGNFDFGFVHFKHFESAASAVEELDHWHLQKTKLIVAFSREAKLSAEYQQWETLRTFPEEKRGRQNLPTQKDMLYMSRVRDVCSDVNKSVDPKDLIDLSRLFEELDMSTPGRVSGSPFDVINMAMDQSQMVKRLKAGPAFFKESQSAEEAELFLKQISNIKGALEQTTGIPTSSKKSKKKKKSNEETSIDDIKLNPVLKMKFAPLIKSLKKENQSSSSAKTSPGTNGQETSSPLEGEAASTNPSSPNGTQEQCGAPLGSATVETISRITSNGFGRGMFCNYYLQESTRLPGQKKQ